MHRMRLVNLVSSEQTIAGVLHLFCVREVFLNTVESMMLAIEAVDLRHHRL